MIRLSRVTDATTSPERQLEACKELCEQRGYEVVGIAEDLDVSAGATTPFTRPKLGPWLQNRHNEIDVIVMYRMDRLVRRLLDLADMIRWGQAHDVAIVSATEAFLDLTAPFGDIIAMLVAKTAEMELEAISARNASAFRHNFQSGRWRGGVPPWGYKPEKVDGTWRLVQDPEQVRIIREVVDAVLDTDAKSLRSIAADLTSKGVLTPKDRFAELQGREVKGYAWASGRLKESLTSRTLLGQIVTREPLLDGAGQVLRDAKGKKRYGPEIVVTGDDGEPVVRAEPILTRETLKRVEAALAKRAVHRAPETTSGLLLRVLFCQVCGRPAYRLKGGPGRRARYRCAYAQDRSTAGGRLGPCDNKSIALEEADGRVADEILSRVGSLERMRREWTVGNDTSAELAEVDAQLTDLVDLIGVGSFKRGSPQRERLDARIAALAARQDSLRSTPSEPSGWRYVGTGETVAEWWESADAEARNLWLRSSGVRATWRSSSGANGRLVVDNFSVDVGSPDLDSPTLPAEVARMAELRSGVEGRDETAAGLFEAMAGVYWREGGSRVGRDD